MKCPVHRVGAGPPQVELFEPQPTTNRGGARAGFVDPDPATLYVGGMLLADYLSEAGCSEVLHIRRLVRSLDLTAFRSTAKGTGRSPYHPALMLGLVWFATSQGLASLRDIERFARTDVRAWWLTGGAAPDYSTIGRFLNRHAGLLAGSAFEGLTRKIVELVGDQPADVAIDGTTAAAMSRRYRLLVEESAKAQASEARQAAESCQEADEKAELLAEATQLERAAELARQRTEARSQDRGTYNGEAKVAESDPDAVYQKLKDGSFAPSFKPVIAATKSRIVVGVDVQPSNENKAVGPILEQAERIAEKPVERARADAGFFSGDVIQTMLDHGVQEPLITDRAAAEHLREKTPNGKSLTPASDFSYDGARDTYRCPEGHTLHFVTERQRRGKKLRTYGGAPCSTCPVRARCTTSKKSGRTIVRSQGADLLEAMSHYMSSPRAIAEYKQRAAMVEPVFADLIQRQGFRRFRRAGLPGVRLEFALQVAAHNLNRYLDLTGLRGAAAAAVAAFLTALALVAALWPCRDTGSALCHRAT